MQRGTAERRKTSEAASIKLADPNKFTPPNFALNFQDFFDGPNRRFYRGVVNSHIRSEYVRTKAKASHYDGADCERIVLRLKEDALAHLW
jgi:hypothetical protein